jgi:ankyrin repeat protein
MQARITLITNYSTDTRSDPIRHVLEEMSSCWETVDDAASASPLRYLQRNGLNSPSTLSSLKNSHFSRLDQLGLAPLQWAARKRDLKLARTLLITGANPDVLGSQGMTPLCHAVGRQDVECVKLLLRAGADVNIANRYGEAPIIYCFDRPDILQLLLDHGASLCQRRNFSGWSSPLGRAAFCSLDYKEKDSTTANWSESLDLLVDAGLDIDFPEGDWKQAPLSMALGSRNAPLVELLIDRGANLGSLDIQSNTILHYAARWAQKECIHVLRRANISEIDPDAENLEGISPTAILNQRIWAPESDMKPGEDKITEEDFWAFTELIEEIRERNLQVDREEPIARIQTPPEHDEQASSALRMNDYSRDPTGGRKHSVDDSRDSDTDEFFDAEA